MGGGSCGCMVELGSGARGEEVFAVSFEMLSFAGRNGYGRLRQDQQRDLDVCEELCHDYSIL